MASPASSLSRYPSLTAEARRVRASIESSRNSAIGRPVLASMANGNDYNQRIIDEFRANGGKVGGEWDGYHLLLLHSTGAKTGQPRQTLLGYIPDGDNAWLITASFGGNAKNPAWYHNLAAHPDQAEIEIRDRKVKVTASQLTGQEREAAWQRFVATNSRYGGYPAKTDRVIPVIRLTATD